MARPLPNLTYTPVAYCVRVTGEALVAAQFLPPDGALQGCFDTQLTNERPFLIKNISATASPEHFGTWRHVTIGLEIGGLCGAILSIHAVAQGFEFAGIFVESRQAWCLRLKWDGTGEPPAGALLVGVQGWILKGY